MGEIGVALVDRFVLADEAAEVLRERARSRLERRIGEALIGLDRLRGGGGDQQQQQQQQKPERSHDRASARSSGSRSSRSSSAVSGAP